MINVVWFNLLGYMSDGSVKVPRCLECRHQLGSPGDGLVYCAYCLEKEE